MPKVASEEDKRARAIRYFFMINSLFVRLNRSSNCDDFDRRCCGNKQKTADRDTGCRDMDRDRIKQVTYSALGSSSDRFFLNLAHVP
jgi:hypothetical protein